MAAAHPMLPGDRAKELARDLRAAMKGIGTDEDKLIASLAPLPSWQAEQVNKAFANEFKRDLVADIKSETGGKLEDALVALSLSATDVDAAQLRTAVKGLGTDEAAIIEVIGTRTDAELKAITQAYRNRFESFLRDDLTSDLRGDLEKLVVTVLDAANGAGRANPPLSQIEDDVLRLYKAGEGKIGTNEAVFIQVIGGNSRAYLDKLNEAYGKKHGHSLSKAIKEEVGTSHFGRLLLALVQPEHEYLADRLYDAMKGAGTDEKVMVRLIVGNRDFRLRKMNDYFLHRYEKSISHWVKGEVGGDIKKTLVAVCEAHQG